MMHRDGPCIIPKLLPDHLDSISIMQDLSMILSEDLDVCRIEDFVHVVVLSIRASKHQDIMSVVRWVWWHSDHRFCSDDCCPTHPYTHLETIDKRIVDSPNTVIRFFKNMVEKRVFKITSARSNNVRSY